MLTFDQIKELIELVAQHRLRGIEMERAGFKLTISGQDEGNGIPPSVLVEPDEGAEVPKAAPSRAPSTPPSESEEEEALPDSAHVLTSPIVGTFYAAPSPDAEPYVRVGDRVRKGQVLCIVEAMKLMNEIEADVDGEVLEVFPKNAQPVEYGEPLFAIDGG